MIGRPVVADFGSHLPLREEGSRIYALREYGIVIIMLPLYWLCVPLSPAAPHRSPCCCCC